MWVSVEVERLLRYSVATEAVPYEHESATFAAHDDSTLGEAIQVPCSRYAVQVLEAFSS